MPRRLIILLSICAALVVALPATASAHTPVLEQSGPSDAPWAAPTGYGPARLFPGAQDIPDPSVSRAVYGTIAVGEAFDAYRFETSAAGTVTIPVRLLVPATAANADFQPVFAVIGVGDAGGAVGLPASVREHLSHVEASVPVLVEAGPWSATRETEYEPFVGETLVDGPSADIAVDGGRTYYVIVWDPKGGTGEYRLALGSAERFSFSDAVGAPIAIARIKLGLYGQHAFVWGFAAILAGALLLVAALIVLGVRRARRPRARGRRARADTSQEV